MAQSDRSVPGLTAKTQIEDPVKKQGEGLRLGFGSCDRVAHDTRLGRDNYA